jgi:two-component system, chemotaxis family, chemotaxis protein CheY
MRALIVDDSRFARKHVRALLEKQRIECEEAVDGLSGLERLRSDGDFDVALVDWHMPVMSGLEMVKMLRSEGFDLVKVMIVTTEGETDTILRALEAGADEYLMKPFDGDSLAEKLALMGLEAA